MAMIIVMVIDDCMLVRRRKEEARERRAEARKEKEEEAKRKLEEHHQNQLVMRSVHEGMDSMLIPHSKNELREAKAIMNKVAQELWTKRSSTVMDEDGSQAKAAKQDRAAGMAGLRPEEMAALGLDEADEGEGEEEGTSY
eukprot:4668205-Pyramimonas_sp.AAC.1